MEEKTPLLKKSVFHTINRKLLIEKNDNNPSFTAYENHRHVVTGPSNIGKTYYMLKILEKIGNKRPNRIITRPPNQYPHHKTTIVIRPIEKKESVVTFDDTLGA